MDLALNLQGAVQQVEVSEGNRTTIEALNRLTEEFFRTVGILLYTRYQKLQADCLPAIHSNIVEMIRVGFSSPSFFEWQSLGKASAERLLESGDHIIRDYVKKANSALPEVMLGRAYEIVKHINYLEGRSISISKEISYSDILDAMRYLRNFRAHNWDDDLKLQPLFDQGICEIIIHCIRELMASLKIGFVVPINVSKKGILCYQIDGSNFRKVTLDPGNEPIGSFEEPYIDFGINEEKFGFLCNLTKFDKYTRRIFVYNRYNAPEKKAFFINVPVVGEIEDVSLEKDTIDEIFGLPLDQASEEELEQLLVDRFGKRTISENIVHNMPKRYLAYINRPAIEKELFHKLSHPRLYITTLDGRGGVGKTELAKETVWQVIENEADLKFPENDPCYVIWLSGKVDYYRQGFIEREQQRFNTLADLLDCILYVTGNSQSTVGPRLDVKRKLVIDALNKSASTLLLLDNLETVREQEREKVTSLLEDIGREVVTELRIIITSRLQRGPAEQRLHVQDMEEDEAKSLILSEMARRDVNAIYKEDDKIQVIMQRSGKIPLIIDFFISMLSRGFSLDSILNEMPSDKMQALRFMCNAQWKELSIDGAKLLAGIGYWGGRITVTHARTLCGLSENEFQSAKQELIERSFLVEGALEESYLHILPPVMEFVRYKLDEDFPEFRSEFGEGEALINTYNETDPSALTKVTENLDLLQVIDRTNLLIGKGSLDEAYNWLLKATDLWPDSSLAWRKRGRFESRTLQNYAEAERNLEKSLTIDDSNPETHAELAFAYREEGIRSKSKICLQKSVEHNHHALNLAKNDGERKKYADFTASSLMKLGYLLEDEYRAAAAHRQWDLKTEIIGIFQKVTAILENNLLPGRVNTLNCTSYGMLSSANDTLWKYSEDPVYALNASYYVISGLDSEIRNEEMRRRVKLDSVRWYAKGRQVIIERNEPLQRAVDKISQLKHMICDEYEKSRKL